MAARRGKWHPPPVPTPRIIHLPRRSRLSRPPKVAAKAPPTRSPLVSGRNLGALFDEERSFSGGYSERRARVAAASSGESGGDSGEERWRFQAEILRAECNFLRMEREVALRKLERNRAQMEATLRSAMETLVSGRKKIDGSENVGGAALEEEIEELEDKLEELQVERSTTGRKRGSESFRELQRSNINARNFDRQASVLRRRLEKMADETSVREIREIAATEEKQYADHHCRFPDVEMLKRRMEGLSKGMLERMEEYGCLLSANSSSCSHSTITSSRDSTRRCASGRRVIECTGMAEKAHNHYQQQEVAGEKEWAVMGPSGNCCNCKVVVGRIMEQVRAEIEQWSEMQGMLEQVRVEMEELQSSRDLWQHRAITSDINIHSIQTQMLEWKRTARASEHKVTELENEVSELQMKLQYSTRADQLLNPPISSARTRSETRNQDVRRIKNQQQRLLDFHREKEKHVLVCRLKNPHSNFPRRLPLQDIGNNLREK